MKKEYPLLFDLFCREIYYDIENIEEIHIPNNRGGDFTICIKGGDFEYTPKGELEGFIFNNGIIFCMDNIHYIENKLNELYNIKYNGWR